MRKPTLQEVFQRFDINKTGVLDSDELFRMVQLSKPEFTKQELVALLKKIDTNHDDKVQCSEFVSYYFHLFEGMCLAFVSKRYHFAHDMEDLKKPNWTTNQTIPKSNSLIVLREPLLDEGRSNSKCSSTCMIGMEMGNLALTVGGGGKDDFCLKPPVNNN